MRILFVSDKFPAHDCSSGDLRFLTILGIVASRHDVHYHSYRTHEQIAAIGREATDTYRRAVVDLGISVADDFESVLKHYAFDVIIFEFYVAARRQLLKARYWQPDASIVIDTVDVHYKRLFSQAAVTGRAGDFSKARRMKRRETAAYRNADALIAVTDDDRAELLKHDRTWRVHVVPNIHEVQPLCNSRHGENTLVFIGGFIHNPNVDAVLYFCSDVMPLLTERFPDISLTIVGSFPPPEVEALASDRVRVLGYVPETKPYLHGNCISIAPLRFGAGLKGKVGEAMSHGLPVVTTTVGIEGFGLNPGVDVLVGDSPQAFAAAVARLLEDREFYESVRRNGWQFISERYSQQAVGRMVFDMLESSRACPRKKLGVLQRLRMELSLLKRRWKPANPGQVPS